MSGYSELKSSINRVIKTNDNREITGQILQNTLNSMVNSLGANYHFSGIASPITNPGTPDQNIFYVTSEEGTYVNFDRIELGPGLSFLLWRDNQWSYETLSTGDATKKWVQENYVSIDFFRSLFRAYDENGNEILPNNNPEDALPAVVDNIKAMVGFWTEQYLSALGRGPSGGGGGGSTTLDGLDDVELTSPLTSGQVLTFDDISGKWVNGRAGTDIASVWAALAAPTNEQINISHLTDALADYATKTYVEQNFITVAYFDRLFRAYNGDTPVSHNDTTTVIDNIKAMFGFWTDMYLSALGRNSVATGLGLDNLTDVTISGTPSAGQVLTFDAVSGKWVNGNAQAGATALANLTDVLLTTPQANQFLVYDTTSSKWVNMDIKTINGQPIYGSGDISVGGGASGNYLPLTGGTLTGSLTIDVAGPSGATGGLYFRPLYNYNLSILPYNHEATYTDGLSINGYDGISFCTGSNSRQERMRITQSGKVGILTTSPSCTLDIVGDARITGNNLIINDSSPDRYIRLLSTSVRTWVLMAFGTDDNIFGLYNGSQFYMSKGLEVNGRVTGNDFFSNSGNITLNAFANGVGRGIFFRNGFEGNYNCSIFVYGHLTSAVDGLSINGFSGVSICTGSNSRQERMRVTYEGNVGIGTGSPSYTLHVAGTIYATGAITALSDARKKDITGEAGVTVEQIAHAPAVQFLWKDKERKKDGQQVGTLAQYWKTVLPEVVSEKGGELSMQYGVAALVSSIIIARKVANHEVRIDKMEKWMKKWAEENDE